MVDETVDEVVVVLVEVSFGGVFEGYELTLGG